jgi:rhamnosyltransferase
VAIPEATVVIRAKNSARTIEAAIESVERQSVRAEIVVVDSGSSDATLEIARQHGARALGLGATEFTFGRALNLGTRAASSPIVFALSSHTRAPDDRWIERCLEHHADQQVAACSGMRYTAELQPMIDVARLDAVGVRATPFWGFSNTAASWRRDVWEQLPFDERIEACEDKEWSWRATEAGYLIVIDPRLAPSQAHRTRAGVRSLFARSRREARALAQYADVKPLSLRDAISHWWDAMPDELLYPPLFYRLNYLRTAEIAGRYVGQREGRRLRTNGDSADARHRVTN